MMIYKQLHDAKVIYREKKLPPKPRTWAIFLSFKSLQWSKLLTTKSSILCQAKGKKQKKRNMRSHKFQICLGYNVTLVMPL